MVGVLATHRHEGQAPGSGGAHKGCTVGPVDSDHRPAVGRDQGLEQAQFGGQVSLWALVVIEMVAGEIGERADLDPHPVEPALIKSMRGSLDPHMAYAIPGEFIQGLVKPNGIGCGERAGDFSTGRDEPKRPDARSLPPQLGPDLAHEGDHRGLAAGAGDRRDHGRLLREDAGGRLRERAPGIVDGDEGHARGQRRLRQLFAHDGDRT